MMFGAARRLATQGSFALFTAELPPATVKIFWLMNSSNSVAWPLATPNIIFVTLKRDASDNVIRIVCPFPHFLLNRFNIPRSIWF